jgi:hypothetical protein
MDDWPSSLPQAPLEAAYNEMAPDMAVRTEMDAGPAKVRRRFTAAPRPFPGIEFSLTFAQYATFDDFYVTTLQGGALSFNWQHPITGASATFRFMPPPPRYRLGASTEMIATVSLELLP